MEIQKTIKDKEASKTTKMSRYDKPLVNPRTRIVVTFSSMLAYILLFTFLNYTYGQAMAISATIPVIVVGWLYGFVGGISTALLSLPANILMYKLFGVNWFEGIILSPGGLPGTLSLIFIGAIIGRIRDLSTQIKKHRDQLDELIKLKTEELRETRDHLNDLIESSLDCIVVTDWHGCITRVNRTFLELIGYEEKEVIGKPSYEFSPMEEGTYESSMGDSVKIDEEFLNHAKTMVGTLYEEGRITGWESYYLRKDGKIIPVEMNIVFLHNQKGKAVSAVGICRDITERKKAEKKAEETRDFLENIFKTTADGIMITDTQGFITMVNNAVAKILGYSQDELLGKYSEELKPKGDVYKKRGKELQARLLKEGVVTGTEHTWLRKDGNLIDIEMNMALLKDNKGNFTGVVAGIRDITERKEFEERLKKSEEKYCSLIEKANDAIISSSKEGMIVGFNKKAEEMFAYTREEIMGKSVLSLLPQSNKELNKEIIKGLKDTDRTSTIGQTLEAKGLRKDGQEILVEASYYSFEVQGEYVITAVIRNITERKELEKRLLQSEKLKSLGELAGGVAHDFNNVLAAILGRAQLLKMDLEPPPGIKEKRKSVQELKENVEVIEQAAKDGAETVKRIQEFSRKRTDDKDFSQVDINELINNSLEFTKTKWKNDAEAKGINVEIQKELSSLPSIAGCASELREVFTNIINNALDAMPQGGKIKITTSKEDGYISIKVEDTGTGIPQAIRDRIFDPFFTTKGVQSTGLGMSVSYGIINRHRGTIKVDSIEGKGATFTIKLPISEKATKEEKVETMPEEQRKARILVIEDEEEVRNVLSIILMKAGHEVDAASNGSQGIEMFEKKVFDLVFTDLGMSGMSGWQVAEKVKSFNGRVPVAIITGWNIELDESEMKDKWVDIVIHKPFEVNQVLRLVQEGMVLRDRFKAA